MFVFDFDHAVGRGLKHEPGTDISGREEVLLPITLTLAFLSLVGSGIVIFSYCFFKDSRNILSTVIILLSISDAGTSVGFILILIHDINFVTCAFQAAILEFFETAAILWSCCLAFHLFNVFARGKGVTKLTGYIKYYNIIAWGYPMLWIMILAIGDAYGPTSNWCWIKAGDKYAGYRTVSYLPVFFGIVFIAVMYIIIMLKIHKVFAAAHDLRDEQATQSTKRKESQVNRKLTLYIVVFFGVWLFPIINRFTQFGTGGTSPFALDILQSITEPSQGAANLFVYGLNEHLLKRFLFILHNSRTLGFREALHTARSPQRQIRSSSSQPPSPVTPGNPGDPEESAL